jgi:hypothetical protein
MKKYDFIRDAKNALFILLLTLVSSCSLYEQKHASNEIQMMVEKVLKEDQGITITFEPHQKIR